LNWANIFRTFESNALRKLIEWAEGPMEKSTNQARLPHALITLNATDVEASEEVWDCQKATDKLLSGISAVVSQDPRYKQLAEKWSSRGKIIETTKDLLECYYSSIRVVRIPHKGNDLLVDQQIGVLYNEIKSLCEYSFLAKREAHELLNVDEFQQYLESALIHFSKDINVAFDFVEEGVRLNPIPRNMKDNILKLLSLVRKLDTFKSRPSDVFEHLGIIISSCVVLNCNRERRPGEFTVIVFTPSHVLVVMGDVSFSPSDHRHWWFRSLKTDRSQ
jgi:hypothetical protein